MITMKEETFGPLLALCSVKDREEAVKRVNDSYLGLTASVWTSNKKNAAYCASRLEAGAITINDHLMSHGLAETPWGGYKQSSIGRSHGNAWTGRSHTVKSGHSGFAGFSSPANVVVPP
jgi:acyl-CoA reductase-like NAD-dependent aldehyde dehydrogenase